ncbi:MAG: T9SS type A sorting domain-containing protein [Brumimicrobium sp.]|nr:T9SS type A sorting domain-containing protein [Brumimicrobium sp.]
MLVENTYSIDEYFTDSTTLLDSWACPSISNSTEFYRDTIHQLVQVGNTGNQTTGYNFKIFNQTPFDSITEVNLMDMTIKLVGYYYKFIGIYFESDYNVSGENAISIEEPIINNAEQLDVWYPANPLNNNARLTASIYIKDTTLLTYFNSPCDSSNILYDDTIISNPLSLNEKNLFSVEAFPNPASQSITFRVHHSGKQYSIHVADLTGRTVFNASDLPDQFEIDISQWNAGMYIVTFDFVETKKTLKFIKQ